MFSIGTHVSSAKGYLRMGQDALSIGANTCSFLPVIPEAANQSR